MRGPVSGGIQPLVGGSRASITIAAGFAALLALLAAADAVAQAVPDAGSILRDQPKPPATEPLKPRAVPAPETPGADQDGPRVLVKAFRVVGAKLIPESELLAQLAAFTGQELSRRQLAGAAATIMDYYESKELYATAILQPQQIRDGVVTITIVEGRRGEVQIQKRSERLSTDRITRFVDAQLPRGEPMSTQRLAEALGRLNDQPGVKASASLQRGKNEGDVDIVVDAVEQPLAKFSAAANNHGSRGTGEAQASASAVLSNPLGYLDALSGLVNASRGATYLRMDYGIAVGDRGLRIGANVSNLDYHITQPSFAALQARGSASTGGLAAQYPLIHTERFKMVVAGSYDGKHLEDRTVAGDTGDRRVKVGALSLSGFRFDEWWGGGALTFSGALAAGNVDQRNAGALAADQASRRVQGSFSKVSFYVSRDQPLDAVWLASASLRGQWAGKNLDSTERFVLGGPNGVRAYAVGEAAGDEGLMLNLNLSRKMSDTLTVTAFIDAGWVRLNHNLWANWNAANPRLPNTYSLSGAGIGADWKVGRGILVSTSFSVPLGDNPGRDVNDRNFDGRKLNPRLWLGLNAHF